MALLWVSCGVLFGLTSNYRGGVKSYPKDKNCTRTNNHPPPDSRLSRPPCERGQLKCNSKNNTQSKQPTVLCCLLFFLLSFLSVLLAAKRTKRRTSPARQQAVSSPLGKGTAEMHRQKQQPNHSNQQFSPLLARGSAAGEGDKITRAK